MRRRIYHRLAALIGAAAIAAAALPLRGTQAAVAEVALSRAYNVYLTSTAGGGMRPVTTRGTGYSGITYPWYQWSPDGRYLLLERASTDSRTYATQRDLLLVAQDGTVVRTLATQLPQGDFYPSWALDGDTIVYVSAQSNGGTGLQNTVSTVDLTGRTAFAWRYASIEGCGGGTPVPAEQLLFEETGFGDIQPSMQWSLSRHLAVYSASCAGGLDLTDTRSGKTRPLSPLPGTHPIEAALSSTGRLALTATDNQTGAREILITDPTLGARVVTVAAGAHPVWSPTGTSVYFVQRTPYRTVHFIDTLGNGYDAGIYRSAIERADAATARTGIIFSTDAFGFGYPSISRDGTTLVFSSVDNMTALYRHLDSRGIYNGGLLNQYGPRVRVLKATIGGSVSILALNAGRPALQP